MIPSLTGFILDFSLVSEDSDFSHSLFSSCQASVSSKLLLFIFLSLTWFSSITAIFEFLLWFYFCLVLIPRRTPVYQFSSILVLLLLHICNSCQIPMCVWKESVVSAAILKVFPSLVLLRSSPSVFCSPLR